jgi:hypothetical protein
VLVGRGVQLGVQDRNSGAYYLVDEAAVQDLEPFIGKPVLLEGYVDGAHRIAVLYYRVLAQP